MYSEVISNKDTPKSLEKRIEAYKTLHGECLAFLVGTIAINEDDETHIIRAVRFRIRTIGRKWIHGSYVSFGIIHFAKAYLPVTRPDLYSQDASLKFEIYSEDDAL